MIVDDKYNVFLKEKTLLFYKNGAEEKDVLSRFVIKIYPIDKNDLQIDNRKDGFEELTFKIPMENLVNGVVKYDTVLPNYRIKRLIIGQNSTTKGLLWQKIYDFPSKREIKKTKKPS
jgi:hypothetical protein